MRSGDEEEIETLHVRVVRADELWSSEQCCFGCVSVRQGSFVVALVESVLLCILQLQFLSVAFQDGYLFYTDYLVGMGPQLLVSSMLFTLLSFLVIAIMLLGFRLGKVALILPHVLWQISVLSMTLFLMIVLIRALYRGDGFLPQAAIVLLVFDSGVFLAELWFLGIVVASCYHLQSWRELRRKKEEWSSAEESGPG